MGLFLFADPPQQDPCSQDIKNTGSTKEGTVPVPGTASAFFAIQAKHLFKWYHIKQNRSDEIATIFECAGFSEPFCTAKNLRSSTK
jgi:hypothetical protein